eukprot:5233735-Pyramimonas_sp.AAC.1
MPAPETAKQAPKAARQDDPRALQDGPGWLQDSPRRRRGVPKELPEPSNMGLESKFLGVPSAFPNHPVAL